MRSCGWKHLFPAQSGGSGSGCVKFFLRLRKGTRPPLTACANPRFNASPQTRLAVALSRRRSYEYVSRGDRRRCALLVVQARHADDDGGCATITRRGRLGNVQWCALTPTCEGRGGEQRIELSQRHKRPPAATTCAAPNRGGSKLELSLLALRQALRRLYRKVGARRRLVLLGKCLPQTRFQVLPKPVVRVIDFHFGRSIVPDRARTRKATSKVSGVQAQSTVADEGDGIVAVSPRVHQQRRRPRRVRHAARVIGPGGSD